MVKSRLLPVALALAMGVGAMPVISAMAAIQTTPGFSNAAVTGSAVVAEAERFVGYPYSYTGDSPATGFSCIGFVWYVYHELGMNIPGTNPSAYRAYPQVSESNLEPGDLVFFQGTFPGLFPSHVAIYIGGGKIIGADSPAYGVAISSLGNDPRDGNYWQEHYLSAERPWSGSSGGGAGLVIRHRHILVVTAPSLDLYSGPSTAYTVLTALPEGARVLVRGWTPGWVRVRDAAGAIGWLVRTGVQRDYAAGGAVSSVSSVATSLWRRDAKSIYVYSLNVHTGPALSDSVTFTLSRGSRVAIISRAGGWDEIKTAHGAVGWVVGSYLGRHFGRSLAGNRVLNAGQRGHTSLKYGVNVHTVPSISASIIATSNGYPVHVLRRSGGWAEVRLSTGAVGWVDGVFLGHHGLHHSSGLQRVYTHRAHFRGGRLIYPGVNIHSGPGLGYSIVGGTFTGMRVRVLGYSGLFAHVRTSTGLYGWVETRFLEGRLYGDGSLARRSAVAGRPYATATIRLHNAAGLTAAVIGYVYVGQHVTVLGSASGWDLVRKHNGKTGYVDAAYIRG